MKIECVISHDGTGWNARGEDFSLSAVTLDELDDRMRVVLKEKGIVKRGGKVEVFMAFDNSTIPGWIRPYAQHYFNRIVEIEGDLV